VTPSDCEECTETTRYQKILYLHVIAGFDMGLTCTCPIQPAEYQRKETMKRKFYTTLLFFILLALGISACAGQQAATPNAVVATETAISSNVVIAEGHLQPARDTTLSFQGPGTVVSVAVTTGDKVKAGDILASLGSQSDAAYAAAQLELVNAQKALKDLQEGADQAHAQALIAVDDAQEAYDKAVDYYDSLFKSYKYDELVFRTVVTPFGVKKIPDMKTRKVDKADDETIAEGKNDMDLKLAKLEAAKRTLDRVKDGPDTDQLALLQARLNAAKAGVAAFAIVAPFDGVVMDVNVDAGQQVGPQAWAVKLADTSSWYVETSDVTELEVVNITEGQKVTFTADALPNVTMEGVVTEVSQSSYTQSGDVIYTVKIKADKVDPRLRWGMTVEVHFEPLEN
jgi:multidrug resistance efflux pump